MSTTQSHMYLAFEATNTRKSNSRKRKRKMYHFQYQPPMVELDYNRQTSNRSQMDMPAQSMKGTMPKKIIIKS